MFLPSSPDHPAGGHPSTAVDPAATNSLPLDMVVEVLARVAASSYTDLFNAKLCCREFRWAAEDKLTLQHVSMEKLPVIHRWLRKEEAATFFERCKESGNPEALYRQGMVEFFSNVRVEEGLGHLKRAAEQGHVEASYVYGIILLCGDGPSSLQGLEVLNALASSESTDAKIQECRERIKAVLHEMWIKNRSIRRQPPFCRRHTTIRVRETWRGREYEGSERCEACKWDREVNLFCNIVLGRND